MPLQSNSLVVGLRVHAARRLQYCVPSVIGLPLGSRYAPMVMPSQVRPSTESWNLVFLDGGVLLEHAATGKSEMIHSTLRSVDRQSLTWRMCRSFTGRRRE